MYPFYLRVSKLQSCFYFKLNSSVEVRIWMQNNTLLLHLHLWLANIVVVKIKTNVALSYTVNQILLFNSEIAGENEDLFQSLFLDI